MTFTDPESPDVDEVEESPKTLRQRLAKEAAENQRLTAELSRRDKDLAFFQVGLPDTPMGQFFKENYQGDPTEEAIRTRAAELGLIGNPSAQTSASVDAIDQMSAAAAGADYTMPGDQAEAMERAMRAVPPGPRYAEQIEIVLQQFGRPTRLDDT